MKVLHVYRILDRAVIGGLYTYLESICAALRGTDVEIHAAALLHGTKPDCVAHSPFLGDRRATRLLGALRFARWLRGAVRDYDVVHIHGVDWALMFAAPVCRAAGVPYVVSPHASLMDWRHARTKPFWKLFRHTMGRHYLRQAACVVATTAMDAEADRRFEPGSRIRVIPPGIDVAETPAATLHRDPPIAPLQLLSMGRIAALKGLPFLLRGFARLRALGVEAHLHMLGDGPAEQLHELRAQAEELGIAAAITWHGYQAGAARLAVMHASHVFVLNSQGENYSFATAEALAEGLPVALSEGVGLADAVRRHDAGRIFPINDVEAMARALAEFADPALNVRLARSGHACARAELSLPAMQKTLLDAYRAAASSR